VIQRDLSERKILHEEILLLNQNQPSLEELSQLFTIQEESLEKIRIQIFNEISVLQDVMKDFYDVQIGVGVVGSSVKSAKDIIIRSVQTNRKSLAIIHDKLEALPAVIGESLISCLQQFNEAINQDGLDKEVLRKIELCLNTLLHLNPEFFGNSFNLILDNLNSKFETIPNSNTLLFIFNDSITSITDNFTNHLQQLNFEAKFGHLEEIQINKSNLNIQVMNMIGALSKNVQNGFGSLEILGNIMTDFLLNRVETQYEMELKRMEIQLAAESNDIFKGLFRDTEETINIMWKESKNIDAAEDRINNAKNSLVKKISPQLLMLIRM
jgi:hypothetical protein